MHTLLIAMLLSTGLLGPARQPFERPPGDAVVVRADGSIVYEWPGVRTAYLLGAPLGAIDAWMDREAWRAAKVHKWGRHDLAGECPERDRWCICVNGRMGPYPVDRLLSPEQWRVMCERIGREAERTGEIAHVRAMLDRLVVHRSSEEPVQMPDLTPLLLVTIDAVSRGDTTFPVHAARVRRRSMRNPAIFDRGRVELRLNEAMREAETTEQALALSTFAGNLGLEDPARTRSMFERIGALPVTKP
jgi:hypothetical protein